MSVIANLYFMSDPTKEGGRPDVTFIGKVFDRRSDPKNPRKVLSLDKSTGKDDQGNWTSLKAKYIVYEDGSKVALGEHLVLKMAEEEKPQVSDDMVF